MSTQAFTPHSAALRENVLIEPHRVGAFLHRVLETLREWRRRAQSRRELAMLSELDQKDLGYPDRIQAELAKPFWRA